MNSDIWIVQYEAWLTLTVIRDAPGRGVGDGAGIGHRDRRNVRTPTSRAFSNDEMKGILAN